MVKKTLEERIVSNWNDLVIELIRGGEARKWKFQITLGVAGNFGLLFDGDFVHKTKMTIVEEIQHLLERSLASTGDNLSPGMSIADILKALHVNEVVRTFEFAIEVPDIILQPAVVPQKKSKKHRTKKYGVEKDSAKKKPKESRVQRVRGALAPRH